MIAAMMIPLMVFLCAPPSDHCNPSGFVLGNAVERAASNAGVSSFRVADNARVVNLLSRYPDVGGGGLESVAIPDTFWAARRQFVTILCGVIFIGQPPVSEQLDPDMRTVT